MKNNIVTKYYFAGATRLAVRTGGTLRFLLGDHLGSSSVTTNASGAKTASALYKAFGETRFTSGTLSTDYKFCEAPCGYGTAGRVRAGGHAAGLGGGGGPL